MKKQQNYSCIHCGENLSIDSNNNCEELIYCNRCGVVHREDTQYLKVLNIVTSIILRKKLTIYDISIYKLLDNFDTVQQFIEKLGILSKDIELLKEKGILTNNNSINEEELNDSIIELFVLIESELYTDI